MSHFQNMRSEFVLAGSRLQRVGAPDHSVTSSFDAVSLNVHVLRFGIFELDPHTLELRREGRLIHLRHQPARVLALLLERSGRLVSREEITNELWPSDVDVDVEQGLNHCIKEIRAALGDRAEAPRYIQTLPRRGYRALVEVHRVREPASEESASPETATVKPEEKVQTSDRGDDTDAAMSLSRRGFE
jgi:DNA-binding winged helix-turn-helix (wHTH) protein